MTIGNNLGPPEKRWVGVSPDAEHHQQSARNTDRAQNIAAPRQSRCNTVGRRADDWREGFAVGFRDALRLAQREIDDPAVWVVLNRLAADYKLAGD